jgi:hypothetical protein
MFVVQYFASRPSSDFLSELMAALVQLKQRTGISTGPGGGFITPASVTPVIAAQGGGMGRSGRLLASVMSCGTLGKEQDKIGGREQEFLTERGQLQNLQNLSDLSSCDASTADGRKRMQRVLNRMLNTQVRGFQRAFNPRFSFVIAQFVIVRD